MIYREYGATGKKVSVIGFGGMRFGEDDDYGAQVVRRANELGINYFDTAPSYCNDRSEYIFGKAFKNMPGQFYVSTKSMVRRDPDADSVRRRIETSLTRMGLDKIDFYHMWCIMDLDQYEAVMAPGGPYEGALKAKEEGLIDHLVFSTHCKGEDIRTIIENGGYEGVLLGYNIMNHPYRQEGVKAAKEHNLGVVTMNPLGGGLIPQHRDYLDFIRQHEDESVIQAALRFNISRPGITVALAGMSTLEEVEENVKTLKHPLAFTEEKEKEIQNKLLKDMDSLCTVCEYCNQCPERIKIHLYMEAYNFKLLQGVDTMTDHLAWLKEEGRIKDKHTGPADCIECGRCEELCTQKLPIMVRLKEMAQIYNY